MDDLTHDLQPFTETDVADLANELRRGRSIEDAAIFLCRSESQNEVRVKARGLAEGALFSYSGRSDTSR